jgi:hypothetical protein
MALRWVEGFLSADALAGRIFEAALSARAL